MMAQASRVFDNNLIAHKIEESNIAVHFYKRQHNIIAKLET
jgi:hypothetical protein